MSAVAFTRDSLTVLATAFDRNLGGRDFDEKIFEAIVKDFKVGTLVGSSTYTTP
jgi:molecular chaperone DnaK (HSP70)